MTGAHRPRARLSQNFLHDRNTIERIVAAIDPRPEQRVLEIGPGEGALTYPLREHLEALTVIEMDRDLASRLGQDPGLDVRQGDSRQVDLCELACNQEAALRVVGNLPYNIATPLLFHVLGHARCIVDMHFLLQREVVERLAAAPGNRDYGRLSVMVQYRCRVEPLFRVPPGAFRPAPRVTSQLVRLVPHDREPVAVTDEGAFEEVVARAFGQRRKTLRNALGAILNTADIESAGIDPGERAEQLGLDEFAALANARSARTASELSYCNNEQQ